MKIKNLKIQKNNLQILIFNFHYYLFVYLFICLFAYFLFVYFIYLIHFETLLGET